MKHIYLAFSMLTFILFACAHSIGQTVYPNYQDGHIWVKVKSNHSLNLTHSLEGKRQLDYHNLDPLAAGFLAGFEKGEVKHLSRPYHMVNDVRLRNVYRVVIADPNRIDETIERIAGHADVDYAEKIPLLRKTLTPNDPDFNGSDQWGLFQIDAENAWNVGTGNANVVVAIVDDAVEITHSDLSSVIWTNPGETPGNGVDDDGNGYVDDVQGYDVADMDNDPNPPGGSYDHGTHVAGIAGSATDNSTGVASIGFGVSLMAVKSTNSASSVTNGYDGVVYAVNSGADVINMSWGGQGSSSTAQNIISWASGQGVVLIAAAGNDNVTTQFYPAAYSEVISVASTTTGDAKSGFSNYGSWIDISAPGSAIFSTIPGNGYGVKQGTSMASPMVAGLAGLLLSLNPGLTVSDVENCILSTADNIDAANPSYTGQLGAGRINAFQAMNCVSSTLNWAPVASFEADITVIYEGDQVNFTDLSYYNPTSWTWSFPGGSPSTFNGQNPPAIVYNTAGTYDVTLTVSNANGTDDSTITGYITVNGFTGCDTISNTISSDPNITYTWGAGNGYIAGHNYTEEVMVAEKYSGLGPTNIMGADFYFTVGKTNDPNATITVTVWEDNAGVPGAVVHTQDVLLQTIEDNVNGPGPGSFYITNVPFDQPVSVSTSTFYVGYQLTYAPGDTVHCAMTEDLTTIAGSRPNTMYYYYAAGNPFGFPVGWTDLETVSGGSRWSMHIYPRITQTPPTAVITSNSPICEGEFMNFDGTSSPNTVNWEWAINGTGTPYPTGGSPSVVMNQPGTYWAYMAAYNGCGFYHIDSAQVSVNPTPNLGVAASQDTICPAGSSNLTASGATSYSWSPGTGLSCTTCANPVATPASTTTYTVTGDDGTCSSTASITIDVITSAPTADFIISADTVCEGGTVNFNGAISNNASSYSWNFTGGSISSSSSPNPAVTYASAGTYTVDLTVTDACTQTDNTSKQIVVEVCGIGIEELYAEGGIEAYLNNGDNMVYITYNRSSELNTKVQLLNTIGQVVYSNEKNGIAAGTMDYIDVSSLSTGVYFVRVADGENQFVTKFVKP